MLGELNIDPRHAEFVRDLVEGEAGDPNVVESFSRSPPLEDEFELIAIVDKNDEEHPPGEGGIDMEPLKLPVKNILENTRLGNDLAKGEVFRNSKTMVATHNARGMASKFVKQGITDPEVVDSLLIVEDYYDNDRPCMRHPDER